MQCVICGKEIEKSQYIGTVLCSGECFNKNYWNEIVAEKEKHIIINGECYYDSGNKQAGQYDFLGHSGRRFYIKYFDGTTITTNNLWYQGVVPEEYRNELKDNARFYNPKDEIKGGVDY